MLQRLFKQIDISSLIFFRLVFGILAFADIMGIWTYYHLWMDDFNPDKFQFKYYGFEWIRPLPEPFMSLFFILLLSAAVLVTIGYKYKVSTSFLFLGFTYTFLLEKAHYLNHGYLFCWLSFVMIWLPANRNFSKDVLKSPSLKLTTIPYFNIFILQFLMAIVYFYGGLAKINSDWLLHAMPLKMWVGGKSNMPILGFLWEQEWVAWLMSWSGMLLDLLVIFFLLFRQTRLYALFFLLFFHLTNTILFQIGIFPWLSLGLTLLFFPPSRPRVWWHWLENKIKKLKGVQKWWNEKMDLKEKVHSDIIHFNNKEKLSSWIEIFSENASTNMLSFATKRKIIFFISLLAIIHLVLPFRQHLFPEKTAWTEEGHRYSWRMMLRAKSGYGYFMVHSPSLKKPQRIRPHDYLTKKQKRKMLSHPDMILQFAHYIRNIKIGEGLDSVEIYAHIRTKLNGRKYQDYIDKKIDLAKVEWSLFEHSDWVVPFEDTEIIWEKK